MTSYQKVLLRVSDFRINSSLRSVLARYWIDLQKLKFGSFRGTVRIFGELCHLGSGQFSTSDASILQTLEQDLSMIQGVERVYFEVSNWRKDPDGKWTCLDGPGRESASSGSPERAPVVLEFVVKESAGKKTISQGNETSARHELEAT